MNRKWTWSVVALAATVVSWATAQPSMRTYVAFAPVSSQEQTVEGLTPALAIEEMVPVKLGRLAQLSVKSFDEFKRLAREKLPRTIPDAATIATWEQQVRMGLMTQEEFEARKSGEYQELKSIGDIRQAATRLGFNYLVTTQVASSGDQISLLWSIVSCPDNSILTSGDMVGNRLDLLGLETSYAFKLASEMAVPPSDPLRRFLAYNYTQINDAHVAYYEGQALVRLKRFDEAIARYEAAYSADPNFKEARIAVGDTYVSQAQNSFDAGKIDEAKALAEKAIDLLGKLSQERSIADAYVLLAQVCKAQGNAQGRIDALHQAGYHFVAAGDYDQVLSERGILQPLVSEGVDTAETHFIRGEAAIRTRDEFRAEQEFLVALKRDPAQVFTLVALGRLCRSQKRLNEAVQYLNGATTYAPDNARAWYELARALEESGGYDSAIANYQKSLAKLPVHSARSTAEKMDNVRQQLGDPEQEDTYDSPGGYRSVTWWYWNRGVAYRFTDFTDGRRDVISYTFQTPPDADGRATIVQAVESSPAVEAEILVGIGRCYTAKQDPKNAVATLLQAVSLDGQNIEGRANLALAYVDLHDFDAAVDQVDQAIRVARFSGKLKRLKEQIEKARKEYAETVGYERPHRDENNPNRFGGRWTQEQPNPGTENGQ